MHAREHLLNSEGAANEVMHVKMITFLLLLLLQKLN